DHGAAHACDIKFSLALVQNPGQVICFGLVSCYSAAHRTNAARSLACCFDRRSHLKPNTLHAARGYTRTDDTRELSLRRKGMTAEIPRLARSSFGIDSHDVKGTSKAGQGCRCPLCGGSISGRGLMVRQLPPPFESGWV